ncbi:hypothetical protein KUV57_11385 [Epibacterium sp. DP7N7-1]|nr:hypothetical protein [Epibacterium sp. DP7N7-1]
MSDQTPETVALNTVSAEVAKFLEGVTGVVEANSFETMCLWERHTMHGRAWEEVSTGYGATVAVLHDRPVALSLRIAIVEGQKVLFIDATSELVDWKLIDAWLEKNLPASAYDGDRINRSDAMNFANVLRQNPVAAAG